MTPNIGGMLTAVDGVAEMFHEFSKGEISNVATFLADWMRNYRNEKRQKRVNDSVVNCTLDVSSRPARSARMTARMNIKKQAEEEDPFLKPKAMPRTKASKRKLKEAEEVKTDVTTTTEHKLDRTLRVVLEKPLKVRKTKKDTEETVNEPETEAETLTTSDEKTRTRTKRKVKKEEVSDIPAVVIVEENNIDQVETAQSEESQVVILENSPPISPVLFPDGVEHPVVNESVESVNNSTLVNDGKKSKKKKGKNDTVTDMIFHDALDNLNQSVSEDVGPKQSKLKRTKYRKSKFETTFDIFEPKGSSSILDVEKTCTPKAALNRTFVVNQREISPIDLFAEGVQTVVRKKKGFAVSLVEEEKQKVSEEVADPVTSPEEIAEPVTSPEEVADPVTSPEEAVDPVVSPDVVEFQAPLTVVSKKRKTAKEVVYDALGNVIDRDAVKRTKVITAPTFDVLPNAADGRPMRTRTKVRRFGIDGDGDALENSELGETQRVKRTKKKSVQEKASENMAIKEAVNIASKSKARRASAIMNKIATLSKLPSSTQKYKTPLSTVTNQLHGKRVMNLLPSASKEFPSSQKKPRIYESRVITKPSEKELKEEREAKFKTKMDKEDTAALKKIEALNQKQLKLKQKNDEKLARAKEIRAKIDIEKHEMIVQSEKEKEMKRKLLLMEREEKLKAEARKKKMLAETKLAELEERRRADEEMRLAKIREIEIEQKRQEQERQRQIELEEKRARERLEEKKKMMEADRLMRLKMAQEAKAQQELLMQKKQYEGMYHPRSENDFGLEDELSENSDDEEPPPSTRPVPKWVKDAKKGNPLMRHLTSKQIKLFMSIPSRSPNVLQLFNVSPRRVRARKSSAVWNTTIASPF